MISRRTLLSLSVLGGLGSALTGTRLQAADVLPTASTAVAPSVPVRTLNGWTLPHRLHEGVKEFHLVAEEVDHEFAPG